MTTESLPQNVRLPGSASLLNDIASESLSIRANERTPLRILDQRVNSSVLILQSHIHLF